MSWDSGHCYRCTGIEEFSAFKPHCISQDEVDWIDRVFIIRTYSVACVLFG